MKRVFSSLGMLAAAVVMLAQPARAATIQIQFSGLNAIYDGFDIYDAGSQLGGSQNPAQSDPLTSVTFLRDGTALGSLATQIYADFAFVGISSLPAGGGTVTSGFGGFFDLLTSNLGWGLGLDFNSFQIVYNSGAPSISGTGTAAVVSGQALPFGLVAGTPVQLSFLLNSLSSVTSSGGFVTGFNGAGSGQITATAVPEPGSMFLIGAGVAAILAKRGRRRLSE